VGHCMRPAQNVRVYPSYQTHPHLLAAVVALGALDLGRHIGAVVPVRTQGVGLGGVDRAVVALDRVLQGGQCDDIQNGECEKAESSLMTS
jgi:hypothetical protein